MWQAKFITQYSAVRLFLDGDSEEQLPITQHGAVRLFLDGDSEEQPATDRAERQAMP